MLLDGPRRRKNAHVRAMPRTGSTQRCAGRPSRGSSGTASSARCLATPPAASGRAAADRAARLGH
eukprot:4157595-Pyramimonas_sp.AAC.1